jgi:hypothetical protein
MDVRQAWILKSKSSPYQTLRKVEKNFSIDRESKQEFGYGKKAKLWQAGVASNLVWLGPYPAAIARIKIDYFQTRFCFSRTAADGTGHRTPWNRETEELPTLQLDYCIIQKEWRQNKRRWERGAEKEARRVLQAKSSTNPRWFSVERANEWDDSHPSS